MYDINNTKNVLIGLLIGSLAGAAAMLLFAPQSGKQTRSQIQLKINQLRNRTTKMVKNVLAQVRFNTHGITAGVQGKAGELKQFGRDKLVKEMGPVSSDLDAGKTAVKAA